MAVGTAAGMAERRDGHRDGYGNPSFVEVRARVFFELLSDEGRRWNFASCSLFVVVVVVVQTST